MKSQGLSFFAWFLFVALFSAFLAVSCASSPEPAPDAAEPAAEAGPAAEAAPESEPEPDVESDIIEETLPDASSGDILTENLPEEQDAVPETGAQAEPESETEAEPDFAPEAETQPELSAEEPAESEPPAELPVVTLAPDTSSGEDTSEQPAPFTDEPEIVVLSPGFETDDADFVAPVRTGTDAGEEVSLLETDAPALSGGTDSEGESGEASAGQDAPPGAGETDAESLSEIAEEGDAAPEEEELPAEPSRSVSLEAGQMLEALYPGRGWVFLGSRETPSGLVFDSRRLEDRDTLFVFRALSEGTYTLDFSRFDVLTGGYIEDALSVTVLPVSGEDGGSVVRAPAFPGLPLRAVMPEEEELSPDSSGSSESSDSSEVSPSEPDGDAVVVGTQNTQGQGGASAGQSATARAQSEAAQERPAQQERVTRTQSVTRPQRGAQTSDAATSAASAVTSAASAGAASASGTAERGDGGTARDRIPVETDARRAEGSQGIADSRNTSDTRSTSGTRGTTGTGARAERESASVLPVPVAPVTPAVTLSAPAVVERSESQTQTQPSPYFSEEPVVVALTPPDERRTSVVEPSVPSGAGTSAENTAGTSAESAAGADAAVGARDAGAGGAEDAAAGEMLADIRAMLDAGNADGALESLGRFFAASASGADEALYLQGQAYEMEGPNRDMRRALSAYETLTQTYPLSKWWDAADRRIRYIRRFYFDIR